MKRILALLMLLMLLVPLCAAAEEQVIINKIKDPNNDFAFPEDAKLLEIYFPNIYDAAAALIRYGEYTMLFDCAGEFWDQVPVLLDRLGVTELTYACNSHPHSDHTYGFQFVLADHQPASSSASSRMISTTAIPLPSRCSTCCGRWAFPSARWVTAMPCPLAM